MSTPRNYGKENALRHAAEPVRDLVFRDSAKVRALLTGLRYGAIFIAILLTSNFIVNLIGLVTFILFLVIALLGFLYAYASWHSLIIPFSMAVLAVGGFRFLWAVQMPGLPDVYLDRAAMIWLVVVFGVKSVVERKPLRPPFLLDTLILINGIFLFVYILYHDFNNFNLWTKSYLLPYAAYFMAKNIVTDMKSMRTLLIVLAVINVYYAITSIAEKFDINQLIWPKSIIYTQTVWWNRSNGPFAHAPLFGTVQGMILPVYLYLIATSKSRLVKIMNYAALALGFAGLYFTYTRGSWLAGIAALTVAIVVNRGHYMKAIAPALILLPLISVSFLGVTDDTVMKDRVENDVTMGSRVGVAVTVLRMWRDNPIIGVGFFRYRFEREHYVDPVDVPIFGTINFTNFRHASIHDIYLGPLAETGLFGTLLQFSIYLLIFRTFMRHYRDPNCPPHFRQYLLPIFGGMFVGYHLGGIAIDYRFFSAVGVIFYSAAGIIYGYTGDRDIPLTSGVDADGSAFNEKA